MLHTNLLSSECINVHRKCMHSVSPTPNVMPRQTCAIWFSHPLIVSHIRDRMSSQQSSPLDTLIPINTRCRRVNLKTPIKGAPAEQLNNDRLFDHQSHGKRVTKVVGKKQSWSDFVLTRNLSPARLDFCLFSHSLSNINKTLVLHSQKSATSVDSNFGLDEDLSTMACPRSHRPRLIPHAEKAMPKS